MSYTAFQKAKTIKSPDYIHELEIVYGLDNQRKKSVLKQDGNIVKTKYFFGNYEKTLTPQGTAEYYYLPGGAILRKQNGNQELFYTCKDHLGSYTHITDDSGNLIAEQSYGAWGKMRTADTWDYNNLDNTLFMSITNDRGYTGHEMLPEFMLINMNGRLYDPQLGRMLSPDNYVQMPDFTQNFNRDSYVLNNPLKYTDPSGDFVHLISGAVQGGVSGYRVGHANGYNLGDWQMSAYIGAGAVIGAGVAGLTAGMSSALGGGSFGAGFMGNATMLTTKSGSVAFNAVARSSFFSGAAMGSISGVASGFLTGTSGSLIHGKSVNQSLQEGLVGAGIGALSGAVTGGIGSGIAAVLDGRNFWHGGKLEVDHWDASIFKRGQGLYDCAYTSYEVASNKYPQKRRTLGYLKTEYPGTGGRINGNGLEDFEVMDMYMRELGSTNFRVNRGSPNDSYSFVKEVYNNMKNYGSTIINYGTDTSIIDPSTGLTIKYAHNVTVSRVKIWDNGHAKLWVMDSAVNGYTRFSNFNNIRYYTKIWW